MLRVIITLAFVLSFGAAATAEQRDFPTGSPGANVTYLDAAGIGHPTGCVIALVSSSLTYSISISIYSNSSFGLTVLSKTTLPNVAVGSAATAKVNATNLFMKVTSTEKMGSFYTVSLLSIDLDSLSEVYRAVNFIVYGVTRFDIVADDAQLPTYLMEAKPGIADALTSCQDYLVKHSHQ